LQDRASKRQEINKKNHPERDTITITPHAINAKKANL
jgi:hypothetical protein